MGQFESDDAFEPATAAYIHLRDLIVSVVLLPGDELQRDALEKFYGRAAPDVSSLVGKLADQHLVRTGAAGRIFVAPIDTTPLNDSLHFRAELEMEIVRCLAKRGARTVLSDTERLLAEDSAKHGGFDPVGSAALDRGFHATLFAAESMSCVWDVVLAMSANVDRARAIRRAVQGVHQEEHCTYVEIAAAIARQDSNTARSWMREHLRSDGLAELAEATNHSKSWLSVKLSHTQEIVRSNQMVWTPSPGLRQSRRFAGIVEAVE